jgi:hypothetical protein
MMPGTRSEMRPGTWGEIRPGTPSEINPSTSRGLSFAQTAEGCDADQAAVRYSLR